MHAAEFLPVKWSIASQLQTLLQEIAYLVLLFKTAIDMMKADAHKIVINADKSRAGEHVRRFHAPTIDEDSMLRL